MSFLFLLSESIIHTHPLTLPVQCTHTHTLTHSHTQPSGRAFCIHRPRRFISDIMPRYFSTTRMSSFQRQLNLYGFRRITEGRDKGGYFHECECANQNQKLTA